MNRAALPLARTAPLSGCYTLARNVPAIPVMPDNTGEHPRLGLMTQLPEGADIDIAGPGFNDGTLRVRCGGAWYFVFRDDLLPQRKRAAHANAG